MSRQQHSRDSGLILPDFTGFPCPDSPALTRAASTPDFYRFSQSRTPSPASGDKGNKYSPEDDGVFYESSEIGNSSVSEGRLFEIPETHVTTGTVNHLEAGGTRKSLSGHYTTAYRILGMTKGVYNKLSSLWMFGSLNISVLTANTFRLFAIFNDEAHAPLPLQLAIYIWFGIHSIFVINRTRLNGIGDSRAGFIGRHSLNLLVRCKRTVQLYFAKKTQDDVDYNDFLDKHRFGNEGRRLFNALYEVFNCKVECFDPRQWNKFIYIHSDNRRLISDPHLQLILTYLSYRFLNSGDLTIYDSVIDENDLAVLMRDYTPTGSPMSDRLPLNQVPPNHQLTKNLSRSVLTLYDLPRSDLLYRHIDRCPTLKERIRLIPTSIPWLNFLGLRLRKRWEWPGLAFSGVHGLRWYFCKAGAYSVIFFQIIKAVKHTIFDRFEEQSYYPYVLLFGGVAYALFGLTRADLNKHWKNDGMIRDLEQADTRYLFDLPEPEPSSYKATRKANIISWIGIGANVTLSCVAGLFYLPEGLQDLVEIICLSMQAFVWSSFPNIDLLSPPMSYVVYPILLSLVVGNVYTYWKNNAEKYREAIIKLFAEDNETPSCCSSKWWGDFWPKFPVYNDAIPFSLDAFIATKNLILKLKHCLGPSRALNIVACSSGFVLFLTVYLVTTYWHSSQQDKARTEFQRLGQVRRNKRIVDTVERRWATSVFGGQRQPVDDSALEKGLLDENPGLRAVASRYDLSTLNP